MFLVGKIRANLSSKVLGLVGDDTGGAGTYNRFSKLQWSNPMNVGAGALRHLPWHSIPRLAVHIRFLDRDLPHHPLDTQHQHCQSPVTLLLQE